MPARCLMPLFLYALLSEGCQRPQLASAGSHESQLKALRDVEIAEEQAWTSKDLEKTFSFYADDATLLYPNMPAVTGKDNIRTAIKSFFADPTFAVQYQLVKVDVAQSGDLGYTQGSQTFTMTDPDTKKLVSDRGKWLTVRKKQADGSWKIIQDAFNSDLPLPTAAKEPVYFSPTKPKVQ